ncbi:riboflavin synthase [Cyanobium sp. LEGE 06113]|uniref:riboflavin synthase n=1 Tax=Cyanobium sp. LEGE 06113 TaxID=1297573 RepID=UPI00187EC27B|nr:riboflavin synthase [Cyanobium sp. LEGE 06113]MBE9152705.1 riboflavin synthase [Cyanobium sp. LEGE 06113]MBE9153090.1 riboflavin synthase [Cyanobium sp. LEGE 06113]
MFTGLVQATGTIERVQGGVRLRWAASEGGWSAHDLALGESVAVDGVCLTVAERFSDGFRADVSDETLRRSTLAARAERRGAVNLEPALRLADRLGGHLVSGHVDGLGTVLAVAAEGESWRLDLAWQDPAYGRYVCDKASVCVNGISLTVAGCSPDGASFWIAVIPHTWRGTTLQGLRQGDGVNLEADLLAKYTERLLAGGAQPDLDRAWLAEHGWQA